jgi:hypothetical protein
MRGGEAPKLREQLSILQHADAQGETLRFHRRVMEILIPRADHLSLPGDGRGDDEVVGRIGGADERRGERGHDESAGLDRLEVGLDAGIVEAVQGAPGGIQRT